MPETVRKARVLVVDDNEACRRNLSRLLEFRGYEAVGAPDAATARSIIAGGGADVMITDLCMPDTDGIELIRQARKIDDRVPGILVTGFGTAERAVEALQAGAFWYLPKPFEGGVRTVARLVDRALEQRRITSHLRTEGLSTRRFPTGTIVGDSPALLNALDQAHRVAPLSTTVLITGESGTGKDLIAQLIHEKSPRSRGSFVAVNCGAIPEDLLESELFGHVKGAFTGATEDRVGRFASAHQGTLFLDEVGDMSPRFQVKLLRVLQTGEFQPVGSSETQRVDVRLIGATNQDLREAADSGRFRNDLYYRIAVIPIVLPPLRKRREDIPSLVASFTEKLQKMSGKSMCGLSPDAIRMLAKYTWPGNVRELENIVERLLVLSDGMEVHASDLPTELCIATAPSNSPTRPIGGLSFKDAVHRFESDLILRALDEHNWNKSAAAQSLGMKRTTLIDMIRRKNLGNGGFAPRTG